MQQQLYRTERVLRKRTIAVNLYIPKNTAFYIHSQHVHRSLLQELYRQIYTNLPPPYLLELWPIQSVCPNVSVWNSNAVHHDRLTSEDFIVQWFFRTKCPVHQKTENISTQGHRYEKISLLKLYSSISQLGTRTSDVFFARIRNIISKIRLLVETLLELLISWTTYVNWT